MSSITRDRLRDLSARLLGFSWFAFLAAGIGLLRLRPLLSGPSPASLWKNVIPLLVDALFYAMVAILFLIRRDPVRRAEGFLPRLVASLGAFGLLGLGYLPVRTEPILLFIAAATSLAAHLWMFVSLAWLGRSFSIFPEARTLVTAGPYRLVRHPLYLGEVFAALSLVLLHLGPVSVTAFLCWLPLQVRRLLLEEQVLSREFPEAYGAYRQRVRRLLPGLW